GSMPRDLALNGHAARDDRQSIFIKGFSNDTMPRRPQDAAELGAIAFEDIVLPMNVDMELAFTNERVDREYELHPGIHSGVHWDPFLRGQLEAQYARVRHADGTG